MVDVNSLRRELRKIADAKRAGNLQRFFKTGKGEYAEGDKFLGVMVPQSRKLAKKYKNLTIEDLEVLIKSKYHEERLIVLFILIDKYQNTNHKKIVFHFYIKNIKHINNWDLVDLSAPKIVGQELWSSTRSLNDSSAPGGDTSMAYDNKSNSPVSKFDMNDSKRTVKKSFREKSRSLNILFILAKSKNIWERRIAVLASFQFIKYNRFDESLSLAEMLLSDKEDLIHKAVGWMLREIGKRSLKAETEFLNKNYTKMPRTMLRYAIERFPENLRMSYLQGQI